MTQRVGTSLEFAFTCSLSDGLHARPASHLAEAANDFASESFLTNLRTGSTASLKSVLAIISADVRHGDRCAVQVRGTDEQAAFAALQRFVEQVLPGCDVPLAGVSPAAGSGTLPRILQSAGVKFCFGSAVTAGIGQGKVVQLTGMALPTSLSARTAIDSPSELAQMKRALAAVRARIREKLAHLQSSTEAAVLQADLAIASDVSFAAKLTEHIAQGKSAGQSVVEAGEFFIDLLRHSESEYIRERALDVEEICLQLLEEMYGRDFQSAALELNEPSIVVAETLAPQQLLGLDRRWLKALVLEYSGATSHAVILARSLGIPTLVGVKSARAVIPPGQEVIVDAVRGFVVTELTPAVERFYERERKTLASRQDFSPLQTSGPAITADGRTLEVGANASSHDELTVAFENGADGIGLFRTEMAFLQSDRPPSEEEQFAIYSEAARGAKGRRVIIRTFDLGGDKAVPYLDLPAEDNPFLGYRGVRIYAEYRGLLQAQLRAILRASAFGQIQIMVPMISSLEEVLQFKNEIEEAKRDLERKGISFQQDIPIGIMIEIPSAGFILDQLCSELDFFSLGTNDLNQYFLAADRDNPKVTELSNVLHPGFLRFLKQIVEEIHRAGKWVGMCGEMAGEIRHLPLLVGLGLDEISVPPSQIPAVKRALSQLSAADGKRVLDDMIASRDKLAIENLLDRAQAMQSAQPLLSKELVRLGSESKNKEEAMQEIVDAFYIAGRTEDRQRLEEALWLREAAYSTGVDYGFAIPHCKTEAVVADSVGVLKLSQPIDWGLVRDKPVKVKMIITLAVREPQSANRHLQVLSKLCRKIEDEEFREHLLAVENAHDMATYLAEQLEISLH
jgi:phosphoenolpyruvate-protein phosphotransferase